MMTDHELMELIRKVSSEYQGNGNYLFDAVAAAHMSNVFGWRVTRLLCSSHVYARHQRILGVQFKDVFPDKTELSRKSIGLSIAERLDKFWEIVGSNFKIDAKEKAMIQ